jgi:hypothetical protein
VIRSGSTSACRCTGRRRCLTHCSGRQSKTRLSCQSSSSLDGDQKDVWRETILPKSTHALGTKKFTNPTWCKLEKNISFILADSHASEGTEALLSFWGRTVHGRSNRTAGSTIYLPCTEAFRTAAASGRTRSLLPTHSGCRRITHHQLLPAAPGKKNVPHGPLRAAGGPCCCPAPRIMISSILNPPIGFTACGILPGSSKLSPSTQGMTDATDRNLGTTFNRDDQRIVVGSGVFA